MSNPDYEYRDLMSKHIFSVNAALPENARRALAERKRIYWILGGACSGKSTLCRALSVQSNIPIFDMDAHIYDAWQSRFDAACHPANHAWHESPNGLQFLLDLDWEQFDAFNAASNAEYLDLFAQEMQAFKADAPLLVDGGLSKPSVLAQVLPARQIACLAIPENLGTEIWQSAPDRQFMQDMIRQLPDGNTLWEKFLYFDRLLSRTMIQECQVNGIRVFERTKETSVEESVQAVVKLFEIQ